jgi:ribosomal protein S18 acetylase RimI-like enzyme
VDALDPMLALLWALDEQLERVEPTWWGAVVTDSRLPVIWDANYARVGRVRGDLTLAEVEEALLPAIGAVGATQEHIVLFRPDDVPGLLRELQSRGDRISWDTAMRFEGPLPDADSNHRVEEIEHPDAAFWGRQRLAYREFDVTDAKAVEQMLVWERQVLLPFGKRWFAVQKDSDMVGFGALITHSGAAYVDNMVTLPGFRRRGIAEAIVRRILREAQDAKIRHTFLFADAPGPIRLYERLGFRQIARVASSIRTPPGSQR